MTTPAPPKRHLRDHRIYRITKVEQTRCGRTLARPEVIQHRGGGSYLRNFTAMVDDEPREGADYCSLCLKDHKNYP